MPGYAESLGDGERAMIGQALACSAVGSPETVRAAIDAFVTETDADELMITSQIWDHAARVRSLELLKDAIVPERAAA